MGTGNAGRVIISGLIIGVVIGIFEELVIASLIGRWFDPEGPAGR